MSNLPLLIQIDDVFTLNECKSLIETAESKDMHLVDSGVAQYFRVILDDEQLAAKLYKRLYKFIPKTVDGKRVVGLNSVFRFSKYIRGGDFKMHKDGVNQDSKGNRSILTLNIFLNDNFEGGETDFFYSPMSGIPDENDLRYSVKPKSGRGALFYAQQYHRGNLITKGEKWLIRTDVMVTDVAG